RWGCCWRKWRKRRWGRRGTWCWSREKKSWTTMSGGDPKEVAVGRGRAQWLARGTIWKASSGGSDGEWYLGLPLGLIRMAERNCELA
ncbi:hypothetical protein LTS12_028743, partial [Elasticomyces elasticus]